MSVKAEAARTRAVTSGANELEHEVSPALGFGTAASLPAQFDAEQAEKHELLWQLAELQQLISQEESVIAEATAAGQQIEQHINDLQTAVDQKEAELRERRHLAEAESLRLEQEEDEQQRTAALRGHGRDDNDDNVPEELLREMEDLHIEMEQLQDRHEYLQRTLQQAVDALERADEHKTGVGVLPAEGGCRTTASRIEVQELELELERLAHREAKMVEEQHNRVAQLQEEIAYVEAQSREERWALKEEIQSCTADGEVLEAEIEGVKVGTQRALNKLQKQEEMLRLEVANAVDEDAMTFHRNTQVKELQRKCQTLREAAEEWRVSDPALKEKAARNTLQVDFGGTDAEGAPSRSPRQFRQSLTWPRQKKKTLFDELISGPEPGSCEDKAQTLFDELAGLDPSAATKKQPDNDKSSTMKKKFAKANTLDFSALERLAEERAAAPAAGPRISVVPPVQSHSPTVVQPSVSSSGHQELLTVCIDKSSGASLGIGVDEDLNITSVEEEGLIAEWNGIHSLSSVCKGYQIVEVNGRTDVNKMIKHLKAPRKMRIMLAWREPSKRALLTRARAADLRRSRCSQHSYKPITPVLVNLDDDTSSIASSGSFRSSSTGGDPNAINEWIEQSRQPLGIFGEEFPQAGNGLRRPKLSVIGEDSTTTGGCSGNSSTARYSIAECDDQASGHGGEESDTLEADYEALDRMSQSRRLSGTAGSATGSTAEPNMRKSSSGGGRGASQRSSIEWRYDQLDTGQAVVAAAFEVQSEKRPSRLEEGRPPPLDVPEAPSKTQTARSAPLLQDETVSAGTAGVAAQAVIVDVAGMAALVNAPASVTPSALAPAVATAEDSAVPTPSVSEFAPLSIYGAPDEIMAVPKLAPPGCSGILEWSLKDESASPDASTIWANPRFFEAAMDENKRWVLRSLKQEQLGSSGPTAMQAGELQIPLLAVTAVGPERRDPEERIFSVRHRTGSGERVQCLFRAPDPVSCSEWTRGLLALITTDLRRSGSEVRLVPRLKSAAHAVQAIQRMGQKGNEQAGITEQ